MSFLCLSLNVEGVKTVVLIKQAATFYIQDNFLLGCFFFPTN